MAKKEKTLKLRPLDDRIVVKRLDAEEKTAGGIILPDAAKEKPMKAEVLAVGEGKLLDNGKRVAPDVKIGDIILLGKYSGSEVKVEGQDLVILRESDILAKII